jgi:hypothetical protein
MKSSGRLNSVGRCDAPPQTVLLAPATECRFGFAGDVSRFLQADTFALVGRLKDQSVHECHRGIVTNRGTGVGII